MRRIGRVLVSLLTLSSLLFHARARAETSQEGFPPSGAAQKCMPGAKATLLRDPDVVTLEGRRLPSMVGRPLGEIRVVALRDDRIVPIPFQIDERKADGTLVYPFGPKATRDENPLFDENDLLLFMARDTGDRLSADSLAELGPDAQEIEVSDPLVAGSRAWAYVTTAAAERGLSPVRYVQYTYDEVRKIDNIDAQHYSIHFPWGEYYSDTFFVPVSSGGDGTNFIDRFKARGTFDLLLSLVSVRITEDRMGCRVLSYIAGPIRVVRHVGYWANIGLGIRSTSFEADITYYAAFMYAPLTMRVPVRMDLVFSHAYADIGTDYNRRAYGLMFINSNNPDGTIIDGRMSPQEQALDLSMDEWRLVTGPQCTVLRGRVPRCELTQQVEISLRYVDDYKLDDPPESEPGQIGHIYDRGDVTRLRPGLYKTEITLYMPPHFHLAELERYLNVERAPVEVLVRAAGACGRAALSKSTPVSR
jgi:hypothetical protein